MLDQCPTTRFQKKKKKRFCSSVLRTLLKTRYSYWTTLLWKFVHNFERTCENVKFWECSLLAGILVKMHIIIAISYIVFCICALLQVCGTQQTEQSSTHTLIRSHTRWDSNTLHVQNVSSTSDFGFTTECQHI